MSLSRFALAAAMALFAVPAAAAPATFYGADNGVGPGGAFTNANAAAAAFSAAAGGISGTIDWESGTLANPVAGVTVGLSGFAGGGLQNTDQHVGSPLGFNTTPGGANWLQMWPDFDSASGATATFNFATGIRSFGAYLSDTQVGFPGVITVTFDDGSVQSLGVTKNDDTGGVVFFGFVSDGAAIASVALNTGATGSSRDIWGIDDVMFTNTEVPEPASMLLLGGALLGFAASRRRR